MKKSKTFLNVVFWVMAGAAFATGAVLFGPRDNTNGTKTPTVQREVSSAVELQNVPSFTLRTQRS